MSRNNKSARLISQAKNNRRAKWDKGPNGSVSTGNKGPSSTTPKHGKRRAWFQLYDTYTDYVNAKKGNKRKERREKALDDAAEDDEKAAIVKTPSLE